MKRIVFLQMGQRWENVLRFLKTSMNVLQLHFIKLGRGERGMENHSI